MFAFVAALFICVLIVNLCFFLCVCLVVIYPHRHLQQSSFDIANIADDESSFIMENILDAVEEEVEGVIWDCPCSRWR